MSPFAKALSRLACGYQLQPEMDGYHVAWHPDPKKPWLRIYKRTGAVRRARTITATDGSKVMTW